MACNELSALSLLFPHTEYCVCGTVKQNSTYLARGPYYPIIAYHASFNVSPSPPHNRHPFHHCSIYCD